MASMRHILPDLGDGFVTVIVGTDDKRKSFTLHKNVVCKRSEFFRASLSGDWKESLVGKVELPEDDPDIFRIYVQSLYTGNVHQAKFESSEDIFRALGKLYVLADKMIDVYAKNQAVEAIYNLVNVYIVPSKRNVCDGFAEMITAIWTVTTQEAPVRKLLLHSVIYVQADMNRYNKGADFAPQIESLTSSLSNTPSGFLSTVVAALIGDTTQSRSHTRLPGASSAYLEQIPRTR